LERGLEFRILGPFEVVTGEGRLRLAGAKQRALLALLVLERGKVVATERLIDALWGESPPPGAARSLHVYVSQLRRALGDGMPARRNGGYVLALSAGAVDAERFEQLVEEGRRELTEGKAERAAETLRAALALWRGQALADLAYEPFAEAESRRLDELRLVATEERIESELACGRGAELVPELEALVRAHPLRERLRASLMLALYRAGRQADALAAYREARTILHDELGLEPGPRLRELERAILAHGPELDAPPSGRLPGRGPRGNGRPGIALLAAGAAVLLVAAVAAGVVAVRRGGTEARLASVPPDSVGVIDPEANALVAALPVGSAPGGVAVGEGAVWVANAGDQTITRIDPNRKTPTATIGVGRTASAVAVGRGAVWVASATAGNGNGTVSRIEPAGNAVIETVEVRAGDEGDLFAPATPSALAVGNDSVWTNHVREQLAAIETGDDHAVSKLDLAARDSADGLAVGFGSVWVASGASDTLLQVDPARRTVAARIRIAAAPGKRVAGPLGIAVGLGSVWVADSLANAVSRIDPKLNAVTATIPVGARPTRVAVGEGAVWALNTGDGSVSRIDPSTNRAVATIPVGRTATGVAAGAGAVWVTVAGGEAPQTQAAPSRVDALPASSCSPVYYAGEGRPQYLIASDLPRRLVGAGRARETAAMVEAAKLVLAERGFRAGRFRIGFQACDDSTPAEQQSDPARCVANARAFASNPSLLGIVGPYHSFCAALELPILNMAASGPIAVVSPSNTYEGLTQAGLGTTADEPERYYPTGIRNYVRLIASDDVQGAALALLARELGIRRLFLLESGQGYGYALAQYVGDTARRRGVKIAGRAGWNESALGYRALAERIARSGADGVFLGGCICENGERLLTDLRTRLGKRVELLAPDAFTTSDGFGAAAEGLYVTSAGVAPGAVGARGRAFARELTRRTGAKATIYTLTAAAATEVLLDAIARSDGSRASVVNELRATRRADGILGHVGFDANGDPQPAPISVFRVDGNAPRHGLPALGGAVLDRVLGRDASP
jgi:YVTN family beta-propeller protein